MKIGINSDLKLWINFVCHLLKYVDLVILTKFC